MNYKAKGGKSKLIRKLNSMGISIREAEKKVNAVFDCMTRALWRGEEVEIPGGKIRKVFRRCTERVEKHRFKGSPHG